MGRSRQAGPCGKHHRHLMESWGWVRNARCKGLNCVSSEFIFSSVAPSCLNSYVEGVSSNVMVTGDGAFGGSDEGIRVGPL